ncbi:ATP-binding protein [Pseudomonas eucalypticola]|uniref:histidine kinase n=1 Tax=Pseudomonas eucalypticola TaxID=2599595 RepID=A0A7D5D7S7_9PSED|nr:ATP-binding protein [Pseudomonas eucalypticola]QKZ05080.1 response regulator [Pseudomonas eucalypticola]
MIHAATAPERIVVLAPLGRDSQVAIALLGEAGYQGVAAHDLDALCDYLQAGAGMAVIAEEAFNGADMTPLVAFLEQQPAWSDLPIVLITHHGGPDHPPSMRLGKQLGNVTFLERPFHPAALVSLVSTAIRGRRRQYEARDRLHDLSESRQRLQSALDAGREGEERLRQLNETLEQQVQERTAQVLQNEEALRQSQKMEAVGQLTGGIAHDFNNMLTGIIGSLELMRRRLSRGKTQDLDNLIDLGITSANRAAGLTHRLLAFSRRQSLDSQPVEMNRLVLAMDELLQRSLDESIRLDMHLDPALWVAEADPHQLESALLNLVINARDAMPNGGDLVVETSNHTLDETFTQQQGTLAVGDYVRLSVRDNGCGMPQSVINRAFDPFFTTKPIGQGTGLGLSMIYGFSKQSRGHVAIESQIGKGTTVNLYLPRFKGDTPAISPQAVEEAHRARSGETVLVVEDDSAVRLLVCEVLRELGYAYIEAAEASGALPVLNSPQRIDLLVSDVGLPGGMNGRQLAEIGRQLRPGLKVLFVTGYAEHAAVRGGFLDTGMQMITKPFTFDRLTAKVREMIEN